jgi:integrase
MPTGRINKTSVDALTPSSGELFLWDEDLRGFGVKAKASGAKSYIVQYRLGGRGAKVKRYTIGRHGSPWTPDTARTEAKRLLIEVGQGIDVAAVKQERSRRAPDLAFKAYSERFVDRCLKERWTRSWKDAEAALDRHIIPVLRDKPLPELTRADVKEVLDRLRGKIATRRKVYAILRRMFRWAVSEGDLDRSPLEGLEAPPMPQSRDRVLADWELELVFEAAGKLGEPFARLIRLLILTGQRMQELAAASWSELDREAAILSIPALRAKNRKATDVPLSAAAIAGFDSVAGGERWPRKGLVFTTTGKTPVSGFSRAKRQIDREIAKILADRRDERVVEEWRYHDLRRTLATGLQRLGVRFEVTEAVLNHISGSKGGVAGIYQRHDWKDEKRAALDAWARHVSELAGDPRSSNVVPLRRKG